MQVSQRQTSIVRGERGIVDHLVERVGAYQREVVVNYYVALKTRHFVILAGPHNVDKMCLPQGLADILVGQPSLQWCLFQAHPWWTTHTRLPGDLALAHARFNNLKLLGSIEAAVDSQAVGLPFFVAIERMSPAEVMCYFEDLPRGLLWQGGTPMPRIILPKNLYITGTLDVEGDRLVLSQEVYRHATVIQVGRSDTASSSGLHGMPRRRPHWQRRFTGSAVRYGGQARAKLGQVLPSGHAPLAPLAELAHRLRLASIPPFVLEQAWLYLANAFDGEGRGLFVEPVLGNLRIAQDYVLMQNVLPHVSTQRPESLGMWSQISEYLSPRFPRAHAWAMHLLEHDLAR